MTKAPSGCFSRNLVGHAGELAPLRVVAYGIVVSLRSTLTCRSFLP